MKGLDSVKLERIQLPAQHAAEERNSYNHVLAEGLIRIMNYAAQPGIAFPGFVFPSKVKFLKMEKSYLASGV